MLTMPLSAAPSAPGMRRRATIVLCATMIGIAGTVRLGVWQLSRAHQKEALQAALDSRGAMRPLPLAELATTPGDVPPQLYRRIRLQGRWLPGSTVYLDNRAMDGQPGFYVVSILQPCCDERAQPVAVQRGWAPRNLADRTALPPVATPGGMVEVSGHIAPAPSRLFDFAGAASGAATAPIRQNIDLVTYGAQFGVALRPLSVVQDGVDEAPARAGADGLRRDWPRPATDTYKHYGYAGQWFAFAALMAVLYVWHQGWLPRHRRHGA